MAFVKLDCGILNSTLWIDADARTVFLTALLMAEPHELRVPKEQIAVNSLEVTGFVVPPGWYGFVPAAGVGIIHRAGLEKAVGMAALERLGTPEGDSRTPDHEGRRLVRVDGGYIILNYDKYRQKDHTAKERQARFREAKRNGVTESNNGVTTRDVTQAEAEAEAEAENRKQKGTLRPSQAQVRELFLSLKASESEADKFFFHYEANGWTQGKNKPIKKWTMAAHGWIARKGTFENGGESKPISCTGTTIPGPDLAKLNGPGRLQP